MHDDAIIVSHRSGVELLDLYGYWVDEPVEPLEPFDSVAGPECDEFPTFPREPPLPVDSERDNADLWRIVPRRLLPDGLVAALPELLPRPVDIVVSDGTRLTATKGMRPHTMARIPSDTLIGVSGAREGVPELCVLPPAFLLMQLSAGLSHWQVAYLASQFCGTFRAIRPAEVPLYRSLPNVRVELYPRDSTPQTCVSATAYGLKPLITRQELEHFLDWVPLGMYGARKLRRALPLVTDRLASPLEWRIWALAFCDRRCGSLGIRQPLINRKLPLSAEAQRFVSLDAITPDFAWKDRRVVLEANGWLYHGGNQGIADTSLRDKAYHAKGYECTTLTSPEVDDDRHFVAAMEDICRQLGNELPYATPSFRRRRRVLREGVLAATATDAKDSRPPDEAPPAIESDAGYWAALDRDAEFLASPHA